MLLPFYNMAKRGRKPKDDSEKKRTGYFYEEEEAAVGRYVLSKDKEERNQIFKQYLEKPFAKMVESIIRRYNLYIPFEDFKETYNDTMSYMVSKLDDFKIDSGFKAYSFCGTVAKNYMLMRIAMFSKLKMRYPSFEAMVEESGENVKYVEKHDEMHEASFMNNLFQTTIDNIDKDIHDYDNKNITNEIRLVGEALITLLHNWDEILTQNGSNKFNKSEIMLFIKDYTSLTSKQINQAMTHFKDVYFSGKKNFLNALEDEDI